MTVRQAELVGARCWIHGTGTHRMLFLHGLRGDHHGLVRIVGRLTGVEVWVPDLPGFGESPPLPRGRHDIEGYVAWTAAALEQTGAAILAGHSFGTIVAAAAAVTAAVERLVLVNPIATSALAGPRQTATRATVAFHRLAAALPEGAGTALLRHPAVTRVASSAMVTTRDLRLRRWVHAEHGRRFAGFADRRVLLEAFDASISRDVAEFAESIATPTLLVAAARDDIAPLPAQRALRARFPDARLAVVFDTGHLAHYEAPGAVAEAIMTFLT